MVRSRVHRKILGVIPARYASSRFPGKALAKVDSRTMLEHVYERVSMARYLGAVIIATDDPRIHEEARRFGARVKMTREDHVSGTDRVAEVASAFEDFELVVNIQGDEPLIDPERHRRRRAAAARRTGDPHGNAEEDASKIPAKSRDPNVVKVVTDRFENAIYFSRSHHSVSARSGGRTHYKHIGLYVYRRNFLLRYSDLPIGPLEKAESLEQLRALENGFRIRVVETDYESFGVDTPADLERVRQLIRVGQAIVVSGLP